MLKSFLLFVLTVSPNWGFGDEPVESNFPKRYQYNQFTGNTSFIDYGFSRPQRAEFKNTDPFVIPDLIIHFFSHMFCSTKLNQNNRKSS